jgi:hypothetical protein
VSEGRTINIRCASSLLMPFQSPIIIHVSRHGFASSTPQTIRASPDHVQICAAQQQAALQYRNYSYVCAFRDSRRPNLIAVHSGAVTTVEISISIAPQEEGGLTQQFILEVIVLQRSGAD